MATNLRDFACKPSVGVRREQQTPVMAATAASLAGYGCLVADPKNYPIQIVRWPARAGAQSMRIRAIAAASSTGCSNSGGRARRYTRAIARLTTALPGDDVTPEEFVSFWCDGSTGLYIHPKVWHGALVPLEDTAEFLDRQDRVHARVSINFVREFGCYLSVPMRPA